MALSKDELRRLYPPIGDGGEAAARAIPRLGKSVFCYVSGTDECSTMPILRHCLQNGISLAVPLCGGHGIMTARIITDLSQLKPGRYGIMEPPPDSPVQHGTDTVIVPGTLFDRGGYRLGRGGGYYDRWLKKNGADGCGKLAAQHFTVRSIGLCRPERIIERLPRDEWDIPVMEVYSGG
jgi:5-formyltetrahydrofolate cyclo-ligase